MNQVHIPALLLVASLLGTGSSCAQEAPVRSPIKITILKQVTPGQSQVGSQPVRIVRVVTTAEPECCTESTTASSKTTTLKATTTCPATCTVAAEGVTSAEAVKVAQLAGIQLPSGIEWAEAAQRALAGTTESLPLVFFVEADRGLEPVQEAQESEAEECCEDEDEQACEEGECCENEEEECEEEDCCEEASETRAGLSVRPAGLPRDAFLSPRASVVFTRARQEEDHDEDAEDEDEDREHRAADGAWFQGVHQGSERPHSMTVFGARDMEGIHTLTFDGPAPHGTEHAMGVIREDVSDANCPEEGGCPHCGCQTHGAHRGARARRLGLMQRLGRMRGGRSGAMRGGPGMMLGRLLEGHEGLDIRITVNGQEMDIGGMIRQHGARGAGPAPKPGAPPIYYRGHRVENLEALRDILGRQSAGPGGPGKPGAQGKPGPMGFDFRGMAPKDAPKAAPKRTPRMLGLGGGPAGGMIIARPKEPAKPGKTAPMMRVYRPGHPNANKDGWLIMPNAKPAHEIGEKAEKATQAPPKRAPRMLGLGGGPAGGMVIATPMKPGKPAPTAGTGHDDARRMLESLRKQVEELRASLKALEAELRGSSGPATGRRAPAQNIRVRKVEDGEKRRD